VCKNQAKLIQENSHKNKKVLTRQEMNNKLGKNLMENLK
jgi:hypothetical protein